MRIQDKTQYSVYEIVPQVTCIDDYSDSTSYLIEGEKEALLVDTGWGEDHFVQIVRELTDKPVHLMLTHMHLDHIRHADRFEKVYLHPADIALLKAAEDVPSWLDRAISVRDGDCIDLGGAIIEVAEVGGHTPGSIVLIDDAHGVICTGDAIGSGEGVWMQVSTATSLAVYRQSLRRLQAKLVNRGDLRFLGGHIGQSGAPDSPRYNPLTGQTVLDMIDLIDAITAGSASPEPFVLPGRTWPEEPLIASLGKAAIVYLPSMVG